MFYIFHGEDEFGRSERLAHLRSQMAGGDEAMADLNTTILDGNKLTMAELRHVCDTIPFMAERRLVIVRGLLNRLVPKNRGRGKKSSQESTFLDELETYLPMLPPTTRLFFIEDEALQNFHPILKVAQREETGYVQVFERPKDYELPGWIQQKTRAQGGEIDQDAIALLAALVGSDLRLLDSEIEKLLLYADGRPVTADDVRSLVTRAREASIFDLVDHVGQRKADRALRLLHALIDDGAEPLYILAMLARQIRILIQVKELAAQGLAQGDITSELKLHRYVVQKALGQAQNFSLAQLEAAHQHLVEADWQIKTGRSDDELALDILVVDLTRI